GSWPLGRPVDRRETPPARSGGTGSKHGGSGRGRLSWWGCAGGGSGIRRRGRSAHRSRWCPGSHFFLRQALFEGLGGDAVGEVAELELRLAEEVPVLGVHEGTREFLD